MKQLLITIAALVLVGCADPEVEANKLFTAASQLVQNADEIAEPYSVEAYNNRKTAIELIEKILVQFPQSSLAVKISEGHFQIQRQSIDEIREKMKLDISIHRAAYSGNTEAVKRHLVVGADVNEKEIHKFDTQGERETKMVFTPLHYAALGGHREIAELLIAKGADVNFKCEVNEKTALFYAVKARKEEIVELLIAKGAHVNATNGEGKTSLDSAISNKQNNIADFLRKYGAKTGEELKAEGK